MAVDPLDPTLLRRQNRQQLLSDVLRNARGAPEAALTMGTALADMAGTGLGTLAGMAKQKLSGEDVDLGAATDTLQEGKFTYAPRSEGGQETLRGLETVTAPLEKGAQWAGQKTSDVTGSPALGAAVYTGLNMADPQMLAPATAKVAALRGASRVARGATFDPVSNTGMGGRQRGAWSPGDIADVEGDFTMRSTVEDALGKLKPQEQRARGKQMLQVLKKYGAKEEDLRWSGLNDALASDVPVTADEIRAHMAESGVRVEQQRYGESGPEGSTGAMELDEDAINERAYELARDDSDLEYPEQWHVRNTDHGNDVIESFGSEREAERFIERYRADLAESEFEHYRNEAGPEMNDEWDSMTDAEKDAWAQEMANDSSENASLEIESERDYDAEPTNLESLQEYYAEQIRNNPDDYGIEGSTEKGKWGQYVIDSPDGTQGENYGETITRLVREGRFGRGVDTSTAMVPDNYEQMTPFQKARYEALRKTRNDPLTAKATKDYKYTTHFPDANPLVYTRESTWPKPPGAQTEGTMRAVEELQSDWGQQGRPEKKGIFEPDKARAEAEKSRELIVPKIAEFADRALAALAQMSPEERAGFDHRMNLGEGETAEQRIAKVAESAQTGAHEQALGFFENLGDRIYYSSSNRVVEDMGTNLLDSARAFSATLGGATKGLPPAPFIGDAKKWSKLGLQQAIADAVRRGDQYVGLSPGYTHAPERWGSEDLSWWTDTQANAPDPNQMDMISGETPAQTPMTRKVASRSNQTENLRGEEWKAKVRALRRGEGGGHWNDPRVDEIDLNDPEAIKTMEEIVRQNLSYESSQYADPEKFMKDRAAKILESMRKEQEGQYSPRSHGMNQFYDQIAPSVLETILKEAGSTGSGKGVVRNAEAPIGRPMAMVFDQTLNEWRPRELNSKSEIDQYRELAATQPDKYQFRPAQMHYVEIDPELARAAKRGFKLPF